MPRVALSPKQKRDYMVNDLPYWLEKEARKKGLRQKDLAKALGITPQAYNSRKKRKNNGKPKDVFSYGELLILFDFLDVKSEEKQKLLTL